MKTNNQVAALKEIIDKQKKEILDLQNDNREFYSLLCKFYSAVRDLVDVSSITWKATLKSYEEKIKSYTN